MIRIDASKKSDCARGIERFSKHYPQTTQDEYIEVYQQFLDFAGKNWENLLSFSINYSKDN